MRRVLFVSVLAGLLLGCTHRWVGRPVVQLERELGHPRRIRPEGAHQVYVYTDTLAGRGEMTFTVDEKGIIRAWSATNNVPGPFGDDVFGVNDGVFGPNDPNGGFAGKGSQ
jgi:hypothetical protein